MFFRDRLRQTKQPYYLGGSFKRQLAGAARDLDRAAGIRRAQILKLRLDLLRLQPGRESDIDIHTRVLRDDVCGCPATDDAGIDGESAL